jgi:hypothetical protein
LRPVERVQLLRRTQGSVSGVHAVEFGVVDVVGVFVLQVVHHWFKLVPPEDLTGDVTGPGLDRLSGTFNRSLEYHHDFEFFLQEVASRVLVEGRVFVDLVDDGNWPQEEDVVVTTVDGQVEFRAVVLDHFSFFGLFRLDQLRPNASPNQGGLPHVTHSEHETQVPVQSPHHSVPGEEQSLGAQFGPRHLREHYSDEERVDGHPDDGLHRHHEDRLGALFGGGPDPVPDGVLRLYTEEVARGEVVDVENARVPVVLGLVLREVLVLQVPVREHDQPPDQREEEPRDEVRQSEDGQGPAPLDVHQRGEDIVQVPDPQLGNPRVVYVAVAIFKNGAFAILAGLSQPEKFPGGIITAPDLSKQNLPAKLRDSGVVEESGGESSVLVRLLPGGNQRFSLAAVRNHLETRH